MSKGTSQDVPVVPFFRCPTLRLKAPTAVIALGLTLAMTAGCGSGTGTGSNAEDETVTEVATEVVTEAVTETELTTGAADDIPERIISLSPAATEVIDAVGADDLLIAVDTQTPPTLTELADLPLIDMMNIDVESIIAMQPDLMIVTPVTMFAAADAVGQIEDAGAEILELPSETSIAEIEGSIQKVANAVGEGQRGQALVTEMQSEIDEIRQRSQAITDRRSVLFEISPAPDIFSTGSDTFMNEMIEIVGATNVLADQSGWVPVTEEAAIVANPDVILTNVNFIDDPVNEVLSRPGFTNVNAVQNHRVYYIDNLASSLPNQNIVIALRQMAHAIYPDEFPNTD